MVNNTQKVVYYYCFRAPIKYNVMVIKTIRKT